MKDLKKCRIFVWAWRSMDDVSVMACRHASLEDLELSKEHSLRANIINMDS